MPSIIKLIMKFIATVASAAAVSDAKPFVVGICTVLIDDLRMPFSERESFRATYPPIKADGHFKLQSEIF